MSNPTFNPVPRCIPIHPINNPSIVYYMAVIDLPNSMCSKNPFDNNIPNSENNMNQLSPDLIFYLPAGVNFPDPYQPDSPEDFTTYLLPIYTCYPDLDNSVTAVKQNIIVQDENNVSKTGHIANSKPIILFDEPTASSDPQPLNKFRPFVIQNSSNQVNMFFVGGLMRFDTNINQKWGLTFDLANSILSQPRLILKPLSYSEPALNRAPFANLIGCFESDYNGYESIELDGDTDPDDAGLFQNYNGVNLYDSPDGII